MTENLIAERLTLGDSGVSVLADSPEWFKRALLVPMDHGEVSVDGCDIHYLGWGEKGLPGLVFVHGGGANAYWWAHIAARFAGSFECSQWICLATGTADIGELLTRAVDR